MKNIHGGDIYNNQIKLDFSVNLNPKGCPRELSDAVANAVSRIGEYPDTWQNEARAQLANYNGLEPANVICGNGASELFMAIVRMIQPKCGLVLAPSFYGYEYALNAAKGCVIRWHSLNEDEDFSLNSVILEELTGDVDVFFLCNSNNPTGRIVDSELLTQIIRKCEEQDIWLVLDECFVELSKTAVSMAQKVNEYRKLIVVKAFTKLLAIPGIRVGYALSDKENIGLIRKNLPEWNLSVFAEEAVITGSKLLMDSSFISDTHEIISKEKAYLENELKRLGIKVFTSEGSFLLVKAEKDIYTALLEKGILIRDCSNFVGLSKGFYRIAIKNNEENKAFIESLGEVL